MRNLTFIVLGEIICPKLLSCNDPISLVNEVHELLDKSSSDLPIQVKFSENNRQSRALSLCTLETSCMHWIVSMRLWKVWRVWSKMNTYSISDYWILEWLTVALCFPLCIWIGYTYWCDNFWATVHINCKICRSF